MLEFLNIVKLISALYPILMQTIKSLEEAMPDPGMGSQKLALLKTTLQSAYTKMDDVQVQFEDAWPSIQVVVSSFVAIFNAAGIFKKSSDTPAAK